ncbi:hypothetical protein WA556_004013, partial [Blastocystis sp. ATCC 50177/Nand II]
MKTAYDQYDVNTATVLYQSFYVYNNRPGLRIGTYHGINSFYVDVALNVTQRTETTFHSKTIQAIVSSEEELRTIGYEEEGKRIMCCDSYSKAMNKCKREGTFILPDNRRSAFLLAERKIQRANSNVHFHFDIPREGKYWLLLGLCDVERQHVDLHGEVTVMNAYGHLPATLLGYIPFLFCLIVFCSCQWVLWIVLCALHVRDLMGIHYLIFAVLSSFVVSASFEFLFYRAFNRDGAAHALYHFAFTVSKAVAKALLHVLLILAAMGVGITRDCLGAVLWQVVLLGASIILTTLWAAESSAMLGAFSVSLPRTGAASLVEAVWLLWLLCALEETLQTLASTKQITKLVVFLRLRKVVWGVLAVVVGYCVLFSFPLLEAASERWWKLQWFFMEGVWWCVWLVILAAVEFLWRPLDNSRAYARHVEIATDESRDAVENESLQDYSGAIQVSAVPDASLKAMT